MLRGKKEWIFYFEYECPHGYNNIHWKKTAGSSDGRILMTFRITSNMLLSVFRVTLQLKSATWDEFILNFYYICLLSSRNYFLISFHKISPTVKWVGAFFSFNITSQDVNTKYKHIITATRMFCKTWQNFVGKITDAIAKIYNTAKNMTFVVLSLG